MSWVFEFIIQGLWEGAVEASYRRWGWLGGIVAVILPITMGIAFVWYLIQATAP